MKKITLTYPHAGDYHLAFDIFFERLGYTLATPPATSSTTLTKGVYHSPGQACLPFKYTMGNLIEGLENNDVDVVAMIGGKTGMCRLAYYSTIYEKLIKDNGYEVEMFPFKLKKVMWDTIKRHFPEKSFRSFLGDARAFWLALNLVERIREWAFKIRPRAFQPNDVDKTEKMLKQEFRSLRSIQSLRTFKKKIDKAFQSIAIDREKEVTKIGLVGEFFLLIDQFSTMNMEKYLGELGVEVDVSLNFTHFFKGSIKQLKWIHKIFPTKTSRIWKLAHPYLDTPIGGHGRESAGRAALYSQEGFDGVIHLYPFTCMPEIVASALFPKISKDFNIPILSLCFDEHTGTAGLQTRLEAFIDMINRKKKLSMRAGAPGLEKRGSQA